ncbi:bifunctional riboflavin kinase/FAD synthetase [Arhodomonas aquaeolei]|uniref:bifunctional riboflavin kinase/FAD synthetase n=1 Tax=Arhodomonas aquaeolei TaxID=2369 RepID=UPI0003668BBE|nr:bifunctional riboflavin kinase/FAD synthetase [Arhodomonas aquaeolei]
MELIRGSHNLVHRHHGCVATIGNFDGVHRGHHAVIARLRERADALGLPATVVTFEPHPLEFFVPERAPPRITGLRDKLAALHGCGIDRVVCLRFGRGLADMPAEAFIDDLLVRRLGVRFLMVGDDFRFGHGRRGGFEMLRTAGETNGFEVERMPTVVDGGSRVSSTRVREALGSGDLATAGRLLGRAYTISGRVARGDAIGRELGWRTANIRFRRSPPPVHGIFAVTLDGLGRRQEGVASVGTRPTVNGRATLLETHLFDFDGDIYGAHVAVTFRAFLRGEERFDTMEALREQIARDADAARAWFAGQPDNPSSTQDRRTTS